MELGLILQEELIGIEDLVSEKSSSQFVQDRNAHTAAVLKAQKLMKNWNKNGVNVMMLASCMGCGGIQT